MFYSSWYAHKYCGHACTMFLKACSDLTCTRVFMCFHLFLSTKLVLLCRRKTGRDRERERDVCREEGRGGRDCPTSNVGTQVRWKYVHIAYTEERRGGGETGSNFCEKHGKLAGKGEKEAWERERETSLPTELIHACLIYDPFATQPPTAACKVDAQSEYAHVAHTFLHARLPICVLRRCLLPKFLRRSSVGSLLRVRCWSGMFVCVCVHCADTGASFPPVVRECLQCFRPAGHFQALEGLKRPLEMCV